MRRCLLAKMGQQAHGLPDGLARGFPIHRQEDRDLHARLSATGRVRRACGVPQAQKGRQDREHAPVNRKGRDRDQRAFNHAKMTVQRKPAKGDVAKGKAGQGGQGQCCRPDQTH